MKAGVLSRWKSHVLKGMARGDIGSAVRRIDDEARSVLSAREVWEASSLVRAKEVRTEARQGLRVESRPSLSVKHCQLSGDLPHGHMVGGLIALWRQTEAP